MKTLNFEEMEVVNGGWIDPHQTLMLLCDIAAYIIDNNMSGFGDAITFYGANC
jgi:hypothetical protein